MNKRLIEWQVVLIIPEPGDGTKVRECAWYAPGLVSIPASRGSLSMPGAAERSLSFRVRESLLRLPEHYWRDHPPKYGKTKRNSLIMLVIMVRKTIGQKLH